MLLDFLFPKRARTLDIHSIAPEHFFDAKRADDSPLLHRVGIYPIFDYKDPIVRSVVWELKYRQHKKALRMAARVLRDELVAILSEAELGDSASPILVPVPLSNERLRERGYNQCELLCEEICALTQGMAWKSLVVKVRDTAPQSSFKSKKERLKNLRGAFAVKDPEAVSGKNIVLVDDVTTTCATIKELQKILRKAGAKKVIALTIAH